MKHIIIGTAGHVDHGKTTLIKALSGMDTDRLAEEKKRGITIDLGFAWLDLPGGEKAGIVDVPGHERFVRNMLVGAGGIDLALLIVAADEGVMPQTREHLEILQLLEIPRGLIVVTKRDLVEEDWLELAMEDIREACAGTFLEEAGIFAVSSTSGEGIEELRGEILRQLSLCSGKPMQIPFRQPVDRVFTMEGFGTVVTGTIVEGKVKTGDNLMLYPGEETVRVRSIQVHGRDVAEAEAGQRAALNLAQLSRQDILRGNVLAAIDSLDVSSLLDVKVKVLKDSHFPLKTKSRLHFHCGAFETLCRARVLGGDEIKAGEEGFLRLDLEEAAAVKQGDHFVLRFFSPLETIGGGTILDPSPASLRIRHMNWEEHLRLIEAGDALDRLVQAVDSQSPQFLPLDYALRRSGLSSLPEEEQEEVKKEALKQRLLLPLRDKLWLSRAYLERLGKKARQILENFHQEHALKPGLKREEMRTRLLPEIRVELSDRVVQLMKEEGIFEENEGLIFLPGFAVKLTPEQKKIQSDMEASYLAAGFTPPDSSEVLGRFNKKLKPEALLSELIDKGTLVRLEAQILMHSHWIDKARAVVVESIERDGSLKLADFRDATQSTRKFAVAMLDYFDRIKLTRMQGEARILL